MDAKADTLQLLKRWGEGDAVARDQLIAQVYEELRVIAQRALDREQHAHTLQPTALVHEVYVRLLGQTALAIRDRGHFFAIAASVMRHILVDHARARLAQRRGGGVIQVELKDSSAAVHPDPDVLAIDQALTRLEAIDQRKCRVVEMKFFAGLTEHEIADALGIARATVERDWTFAKSWLQVQMEPPRPGA
jgi:RNA polymerase sigma factor (TIGR02999 family)